MEGLYGASSVEFQKPIHVEPLELIGWLRKPQGVFSQKAGWYISQGIRHGKSISFDTSGI